MDCDKTDPLLLDELYDELDDVTSAAVRKHVASCASCSAKAENLRRVRRAAWLPDEEPPADLEERILAATMQHVKASRPKSTWSRSLASAGSWAMRPQTAMAAVFLLMIGSSAFLLRSTRSATTAAPVSVTVAGTPSPAQASADPDSLASPAAAAAHGAAAVATVAPQANPSSPPAAEIVALGGSKTKGSADTLWNDSEPKVADERVAHALAPSREQDEMPSAKAGAGGSGAAPDHHAQDAFAAGMAAYRARNFKEATVKLDAAAAAGYRGAELWAAKSVRDGSGCAAALPRFESIAQRSSGQWIAQEALLEAARCDLALHQPDRAREKLRSLLSGPSHAEEARRELADLDRGGGAASEAATAAAAKGGAGNRAAPSKPSAATATPAAAPASTPQAPRP